MSKGYVIEFSVDGDETERFRVLVAGAARAQAAADKRQAEAARGEAERMLREASQQLTALDKKTQAAQSLEDKARAASAAAQAREEATRAAAAKADAARVTAEAEARLAAEARDRTALQAGGDRDKAAAEARAAEGAHLAQSELAAAALCNLFIGIARLGKGSHVELGAALALGWTLGRTRIILVGVDRADSVFYDAKQVEHVNDLSALLVLLGVR
jgi:hypothetical protein